MHEVLVQSPVLPSSKSISKLNNLPSQKKRKKCIMYQGPQDHGQIHWFPRKTNKVEHIIVLSTMIYYNKRMQSKNQREKTCKVKSRANQVTLSKGPLPEESHVTTHVKCYLPRKLTRDSTCEVFTGGWSCKHPLANKHQNFRLPEGKQLFSIKYIICINILSTVSHSY